jgi:ATP-dependent exoDNAse (exonuclease V) beta subunit
MKTKKTKSTASKSKGISDGTTDGNFAVSSVGNRTFLGWDQPILPTVVEQLLQAYGQGKTWDMRSLLVVLPSGVARRRLGELLALRAQATGKLLYPPKIVTAGALPEHLYVAKYPFASDLVQNLAWVHALHQMPQVDLQRLLPIPPPKAAAAQWLELGRVLSGLHRELASDRLDFKKVVEELPSGHPETPRWETLARIQRLYLDELDRLELWDIQTARLCALQYKEARTDHKIIVVGCVDLNRTQRGFLEAIAAQTEIWVAAPADKQALFDPFGCLVSEAWQHELLNVPAESLLVGNSPSDQAELTCACLAELGEQVHAREVTLGVPDSSLVPELKHQLELAGITARYGPGSSLPLSEPVVLLSLISRFVEDHSYTAFASLIRHPAIENLLHVLKVDVPEDWLSQIDKYYRLALPKSVDGFVNAHAEGNEAFARVTTAIKGWLKQLTSRPQPISQWVQPILGVLSTAYEKLTSHLDDPVEGPLYLAAKQACAAIVALRDIPPELEPKMSAPEVIDWLIRTLSGNLVPAPANERAVEMLGWLDLSLDDAPHLIITGIHDGVVPESVNADAFLPNQLRRTLGMMDNSRRYARDLYSLQVMWHSRQSLRFVVGKTDASGAPLTPSRLLMACELSELPARVLHLVDEQQVDVLPPVQRSWTPQAGGSKLIIPRPEKVKPPQRITVTAFRDYLKCPYRFYLQHVLRLRDQDDADVELDASTFGNLIHDTLQLLGESPVGRSSDREEVQQFLITKLHETAERMFGPSPPAAVLIQVEQAESRLTEFAMHQAQRAAEGWQIHFTEKGVGFDDNVLIGQAKKLHLIGRIDRIDFHPETGQWAIWDYKTSDNAKAPVSVHWSKKKGWQDLQLPLYLPVAKHLGITGTPTLGYIALPKQAGDIGFFVADFTESQLQEAAQLADEVASKVAAGEFWPEQIEPVQYDDFGRICQSQVQHVQVAPPLRPLKRYRAKPEYQMDANTVAAAERLLATPVRSHPSLEPLLIRASAGTGKTFQLSNRLLQIILSGQEVDHILATTFTRKAAGEIMHRVLERLADSCLHAKARQELEEHLPGVDTSAAACLAALRRVTTSIHRLRVSTLDSFFAQVARIFSLEMGLPPGWSALDPLAEPQLQMQAIGQMLDSHDRRTLVDLVRMLAKGESGRQVAEEIRRTVASGYEAYRTTEAEAWDQLPLPKAPSEAALESALLTLANTTLKHKSADQQLEKLHSTASSGDWEAVVSHGVYKNFYGDPPTYFGRELPANLVIALEAFTERAAAELLPIRRQQTLATYQVLAAYDAEYSAIIRRNRALAFSDVTYYLSKWMMDPSSSSQSGAKASSKAKKPSGAVTVSASGEQLEFRLDCGVQHLLLDEFQDTSPEQWRILQPLATPLGGSPRSDQSFFCVGDTKQAIYGWRGGVAEIFDSVNHAIEGLMKKEMQKSYRSSERVMEVVNEVFKNLNNHPSYSECDGVVKTWSDAFPEHATAKQTLPGYVRLQNGPKFDRETPSEEVKLGFLEFTAQQIAELTKQSRASIGVLFRTNADVGRMIGLLRDLGVTASQDGGNPLTDSVAVELMLSLIHLADHPGDSVCGFHVATSPLAKHLPFSSQSAPTALASWFRREVSRRGLGTTLERVAEHLANHLSWWDQHRLEQLIRSAYAFEVNRGGRLRDFEESVINNRVALPSESQVKVMTVHKSKGLEFDAVFLPDLCADLSSSNSLLVLRGDDPVAPPTGVLRYMNSHLQAMLPKSWQRAFAQNKERGVIESLCLLYVAMTRARSALFMTSRPTSGAPTQQFGSLLQSTLASSKQAISLAGECLYEIGDPNWYQHYPLAEMADDPAVVNAATDTPPLKIQLNTDADAAPPRGLRVAAPSSMLQAFGPVSIANAFSYSQSVGATFGTLIHSFFEQIKWLDDFSIDREQLRRVALSAVEPEALRHLSLDRVMGDFEELLELSSVRAALSRSRYQQPTDSFVPEQVEIDNERVISLIMDGRLISGTIDRLAVLMKDGQPYAAEIIDFKTDALDPSMRLLWLDDRIEHHRPQLEVYAQVVSQLFQIPLERVATYLLMLSTDDLVRVDRRGSA